MALTAFRLRFPHHAGRLLLALWACAGQVDADAWRGELQTGGQVVVDPESHRAMREDGGTARPLWDGVHRLEDGSTVIVRDGVAVPTEDMYRAWSGGVAPQPVYAERWCKQLVRKTCGFDNACDNTAACLQARTLLADAERERRDLFLSRGPGTAADSAPTATEPRCRQALADPAFPACASLAGGGDSRCRELVLRSCGDDDACADTEACDAARQLEALETEERLALEDPGVLSGTGRQCLEAMQNDFFAPCNP